MPDLRDHAYLGDGVYASFGGYHVWLHLDRHDSPPLVALEPDVFNKLAAYAAGHWNMKHYKKVGT